MQLSFYKLGVGMLSFTLCLSVLGKEPNWWEYRVSDLRRAGRNHRCLEMLAAVTQEVSPKDKYGIAVHDIREIATLLASSGATPDEIKEVIRIRTAIENSHSANPLVNNLVARVKNSKVLDRIFVCILNEECELLDKADAHYNPALLNFEVVDQFGSLEHIPVPPTKKIKGIRREMNALIARFPKNYESEYRSLAFNVFTLHETQHFLDMDKLNAWVINNRRLIRDGQTPDKLFKDNVRILNPGTKEETIVILQRFFIPFLESNGGSVSFSLYEAHLPADRFKIIGRQVKRQAYQDAIEAGAEKILQEEKIDEDHIFELGTRWSAIMDETIQKGRKLRRTSSGNP